MMLPKPKKQVKYKRRKRSNRAGSKPIRHTGVRR